MGSVTEIWSARNLKRGLRRHWVRFGEEMLISSDETAYSGVLSIWRPIPGGPLFAGLKAAGGEFIREIGHHGELVIHIDDLRLVVAVRAVECGRALVEFGVPPGNQVKVALDGQEISFPGRLAETNSSRHSMAPNRSAGYMLLYGRLLPVDCSCTGLKASAIGKNRTL